MITFPVWPNRRISPDFYRVRVFRTIKEYHEYLRRKEGPVGRNWWASAHCFLRRDSSNCVGEVLFSRDKISVGLVSHEMTHASAYWLFVHRGVRPGYKPGTSTKRSWDERQAYGVGNMVDQFFRAFFRLNRGRNVKA